MLRLGDAALASKCLLVNWTQHLYHLGEKLPTAGYFNFCTFWFVQQWFPYCFTLWLPETCDTFHRMRPETMSICSWSMSTVSRQAGSCLGRNYDFFFMPPGPAAKARQSAEEESGETRCKTIKASIYAPAFKATLLVAELKLANTDFVKLLIKDCKNLK